MDTLLDLLRSHEAPPEIVALAERLAAGRPATADADADAGPETGAETGAETRLLVWPDDVEPLSDDELDQLDSYLIGLAEDDAAGYELIVAAADAKDVLVSERTARDEVAEAAAAERAAAVARLQGATGDDPAPDGDPDPEPDDDDPDGAPDPDPAPADGDPEPVTAASSGRTVSRADLLRYRNRRPTPAAAPPAPERPLSTWEFAHDVPNVPGDTTTDLADVDRALIAKRATWRSTGTRGDGLKENVRVASLHGHFPPERRLMDETGKMLSPSQTANRVRAAIDEGRAATIARHNGLVAAGGLCDLETPIYSLPTYGVTSRPIRDQALVSFQGNPRGTVAAMTPPVLGDVADAVSIWTIEDDEAAADPDDPYASTKPCLRVECGDIVRCTLHAVPVCLTMGNFKARAYPELEAAWTRLSMVAQARVAEITLFQQMVAQSISVDATATQVSAVRDVLTTLDDAATGIRSRNRMEDNDPMIVILPSTFRTTARNDIARQMPGGPTQGNLVLADQAINEWFRSRFLSPVWSKDIGLVGAQPAGSPLTGMPSTIDALIYPAGTFIHVDGGVLDLGLVRDTSTNAVNDFQIFSESFECVLRQGTEALHLPIEVCPSGAVSGTLDPAEFCA